MKNNRLKAWSFPLWKNLGHTQSNSDTIARWSSITFFYTPCITLKCLLITLTWKVKCLKSLNICFFLFFSFEFALTHRRLSFQCSSRSSLLYRSVFKMAAIQFICQRILARSVNFDLSYSALPWKLTGWVFFVQRLWKCNIWIAEFFEFYTFNIRTLGLLRITYDCKQCCLRLCVSASHAQRPCAFMDNVCICE
jgi:hypothetical protein